MTKKNNPNAIVICGHCFEPVHRYNTITYKGKIVCNTCKEYNRV